MVPSQCEVQVSVTFSSSITRPVLVAQHSYVNFSTLDYDSRSFPMRARFAATAFLALCLLTLAASVGFSQFSPVANPQQLGSATQAPSSGGSKRIEFSSGFRVECLRKIDVAAQADGLIQSMNVEEGDTVPADGVLFSIDNRVAKAQYDVATKKLESAIKQAEQEAEKKFAEATYQLAKYEFEKEMEIFVKRASTETAVRRKELDKNKALLQIEVATVKQETDALAVGVAEAEQNAARVQLSLYDIVAPWDAYVNERLKDQGAWIKAGEPVLKIHHLSEMRVTGYIKIDRIYDSGLSVANLEGAKLQVVVDIAPNQQHVAPTIINFVSSEVDNNNMVRVSARLKNERLGNSWILRDGMPARVTILVD